MEGLGTYVWAYGHSVDEIRNHLFHPGDASVSINIGINLSPMWLRSEAHADGSNPVMGNV